MPRSLAWGWGGVVVGARQVAGLRGGHHGGSMAFCAVCMYLPFPFFRCLLSVELTTKIEMAFDS